MVELFLRKRDVYIRKLHVRMRISAIYSPTPQRLVHGASSGLRGGADDGDRPNWWANSEIEHHLFANTNAGLWFHICCPNLMSQQGIGSF